MPNPLHFFDHQRKIQQLAIFAYINYKVHKTVYTKLIRELDEPEDTRPSYEDEK